MHATIHYSCEFFNGFDSLSRRNQYQRRRVSKKKGKVNFLFASRSSIVQDVAKRMTTAFALNLEARLNQPESGRRPVSELNAGSLLFSSIWTRIKSAFRAVLGR